MTPPSADQRSNARRMTYQAVWETADNYLRNVVEPEVYGDYITPFLVLRRSKATLAPKKQAILDLVTTDRQKQRLDMLWATDDDYVALEVTWLFYQGLIAACGHPKKSEGKKLMMRVIRSLRKGLPAGLEELAQLGRTLWRRREDVLAYFDIGASSGPVEAIDGRLEHLRGIALGFKNLDHYILRCLIHSGQLQGKINAL